MIYRYREDHARMCQYMLKESNEKSQSVEYQASTYEKDKKNEG